MESVREAARVATSKPVQRAVVNTVLLVISAASLLGLASIATALFFQNYLPEKAVSSPLYLQYGSTEHPYGIATLSPPQLKSEQEYDISVALSMPKSPANLDRGNFMVRLLLIDSKGKADLAKEARAYADFRTHFTDSHVLYQTRRPALVPYSDPLVSLASRVLWLGYYLLFPKAQALHMTVQLAERVSFPKDALIPASAYVEIEGGQNIQVYDAQVTLTAQLRGLRYIMHHYRILSFTTFTALFWLVEVLFMSAAWAVWVTATGSADEADGPGGKSYGSTPGGSDGDGYHGGDQHSESSHGSDDSGSDRFIKDDPGFKKEEEASASGGLADIPHFKARDGADDVQEHDAGDQSTRRFSLAAQTGYRQHEQEAVRRKQ